MGCLAKWLVHVLYKYEVLDLNPTGGTFPFLLLHHLWHLFPILNLLVHHLSVIYKFNCHTIFFSFFVVCIPTYSHYKYYTLVLVVKFKKTVFKLLYLSPIVIALLLFDQLALNMTHPHVAP